MEIVLSGSMIPKSRTRDHEECSRLGSHFLGPHCTHSPASNISGMEVIVACARLCVSGASRKGRQLCG